MPSELEIPATNDLLWRRSLRVIIYCILFSGCRSGQTNVMPSIEFSRIPQLDEGGTSKIVTIEGRVISARPGQQIVLFARSGAWYIQPFTEQPFTKIQPDSTWKNSTHLGTEYAALLVEPEYRPPVITDVLPNKGGGVVAVAVVKGEVRLLVPAFWETWWFRLSAGLACIIALITFHHLRLSQLTRHLNTRFEERLEERMRIAQDLHDTLLQGFLSASMHLHVAIERLPEDSQVKGQLDHVQKLIGQVIEEGLNTVRGLRSITADSLALEQAFSHVQKELGIQEPIGFRVIVEGQPRPLHPIIRDEVYRIGREVLVNAFHQLQTRNVEIELKYAAKHLRVLVRDDGCGIDPQLLRSGRNEDSKLSGLRNRAEKIGARLKIRSQASKGSEVELIVPGNVAFLRHTSIHPMKWIARLSPHRAIARLWKTGIREDV